MAIIPKEKIEAMEVTEYFRGYFERGDDVFASPHYSTKEELINWGDQYKNEKSLKLQKEINLR